MLKLVFPFLLASASTFAATPPAVTYGVPDCRINTLLPEPSGRKVSWSGACKDGFADGPGILAWNDADDSRHRIDGTLVRGSVTGAAKLTWEPAKKNRGQHSFEGTLRDGRPDGQGFFQYADGAMYEGGVANGKPQGAGCRDPCRLRSQPLRRPMGGRQA
jgi:hypothetical protein